MGRFPYFPLIALSGGVQGSAQEPQELWISWVSTGYMVILHCSRASLSESKVCFRRASQVSCVLLPHMSSTGFLQIPISFHSESTREKWGVHFRGFPKPQLLHVSTPCGSGTRWFSPVSWWAATFSVLQAHQPHLKGAHPYTLTILNQCLTNLYSSSTVDAASLQIRARHARERSFLVKNLSISVSEMLCNKVIIMAFLEGQLGNTFIKA